MCECIVPLTDTTMSGPRKKSKKAKPIIHRYIPANPSVAVKTQEFKQSSRSHLTSTTSRSSVPLVPQTPPDDPTGDQLYSDVNKELLEKVAKNKRKGPSRSVSVSATSCPLLPCLASNSPDRRCWKSGSNTKMNSWMSMPVWSPLSS